MPDEHEGGDIGDVMAPAWAGFVQYAITDERVVEQFERETGVKFSVATTPIDRMIDEATGRVETDIEKFVLWVTERYWGVEYAPEAIREKIAALAGAQG
jgi:hypothetical protein